MSTTTPNLNFYLPDPGDGSENGKPWGPQVTCPKSDEVTGQTKRKK